MKAQVSQLQYLQDALSEQKALNQSLKTQATSLKTALEEAFNLNYSLSYR